MELKQCSKCGEVKSIESFAKGRNCCKFCRTHQQRQYRDSNMDSIILGKRNWYSQNRGKVRDGQRMYYERNKETILSKVREYREVNKEKINSRNKAYSKKNRLKLSKITKEWHRSNPDKIKAYKSAAVEELKASYIKSSLIISGFPKESITNELIETKRLIIKTKRYVKSKTNSSTKHPGITLQNG